MPPKLNQTHSSTLVERFPVRLFMSKQIYTTTTRSLLAIAQGLVDGVLVTPPSMSAALIRRARTEAENPDLAQPYTNAATAWQSAQKAHALAAQQAEAAAAQVREANRKYDSITSTVVYSQELMELRHHSEDADLARAQAKIELTALNEKQDRTLDRLMDQGGLRGRVALARYSTRRPGPVLSGLSRLFGVEELCVKKHGYLDLVKQLRADHERAQREAEQAKDEFTEAVSTHPAVRAAFAEKEASLRERGRLVRHAQEINVSAQQYAAQLWSANQARWSQPHFQELVQAVAELDPALRVKLHDDLNRLAGRPTALPEPPPAQRTRIAGAPAPRTRVEAPSPAAETFTSNSVVWWMLLYPADYGHGADVRRQCDTFVGQLSQDSALVQTVATVDPSGVSISGSSSRGYGVNPAPASSNEGWASAYTSSSDSRSSYDSSPPTGGSYSSYDGGSSSGGSSSSYDSSF